MTSEAVRLNLFETRALFDLATRGTGTYEVRIAPQSNSMFSTLFLSAIDPGTTITVDYRESTTGDAEGEDYVIGSHTIPPAGPSGVHKLTVAPHHNKPRLEVTITGGTARFGVYVTSVSSFAVDFSQALVHDGAVINLINSGGLIPSVYDPSDGKAYLARGTHGVLDVNVITGSVGSTAIQKSKFDEALAVLANTTQLIVSYTVPFGKIAKLQRVDFGGDNIATFDVKLNSVTIARNRTYFGSFLSTTTQFDALPLVAGNVLQVFVYNFRSSVGNFESRIQYLED